MTQIREFGWESDRLYKNKVEITLTTPDRAISITGFNIKLAMEPSDTVPFALGYASAQVLWFMQIQGIPPSTDDWGQPVYTDYTGSSQNLHGGGTANNNLAASILKACPWYNSVNEFVHMTGLKIAVPPKSTILFHADHAGQGPIDFECQGAIFYD